PGQVRLGKEVTFIAGGTTDLGATRIFPALDIELDYCVTSRPDFDDLKIQHAALKGGDSWRRPDGYGSYLQFQQSEESLSFRAFYAPCAIADLGEGKLEDFKNVDHRKVKLVSPDEASVNDGHVYLLDQKHFNVWALFRVTYSDNHSKSPSSE